jgi:hypothetical protein
MKQKDFRQKRSKAVRSKMIGLLVIVACFCTGAQAQVTIGNGDAPAEGALLDVKETNNLTGGATSTKGILFPRVALVSQGSLLPLVIDADETDKSTHKGIVVYNVVTSGTLKEGLYSWDGNEWVYAQNDTQAWNLTGNAGTDPANNYVGTSDAKALSIRTNATERMRLGEDGKTYLKSIGGTTASTNDVSQLVADNVTGEVLKLMTQGNSKTLNYLVYEIECSNTEWDWIKNFDTRIDEQFTLVVVGSSFNPSVKNSGLVSNGPSTDTTGKYKGSFSPSTVRAFLESGTWRLEADYLGGAPVDEKPGTWVIYCLAINHSIVKKVTVPKFKIASGNTGTAAAAPTGLYENN